MNSSLLKRLKYYGFGFLLGCIFVFFFFQNRGCSWTPSNRVKSSIIGRVITVNEVEKEIMKKHNLTFEEIFQAISEGDVDFKNSKKDTEDKIYLIHGKIKDKGTYKFYFTLPTESYISELHIGADDIQKIKPTASGKGYFLHFPNDEYLVYPDSTKVNECKLDQLGINSPQKILKAMKENAYLSFENTKFETRPKPTHQIVTIVESDTVRFNTIWYKNKIFIQNIQLQQTTNCDSLLNKK